MFDLSGKVAVVTGGSGALGSAISRGLADAGAQVVVLARSVDMIQTVVDDINANNGIATGVQADVLDRDTLSEAARNINQQFGSIDILINGAGGNQKEATAIPGEQDFFDLPLTALKEVTDLNLIGTILPSQVFGTYMAQQQHGVIINISSMASYQPLTRVVAYGAAKAAVNNFTQWLAVYMAAEQHPSIRVNAIAPGFFVGEQNRYLLFDAETGELTPRGQQIIAHTPMGRFGEAEELIGAINWLASDAAKFVTGIVIPVDGGFSAYSGV